MAHIPNPHLKLDLEHGEGTSTQNIPPDLAKSLPLITKLKPDNGTISYFHGLEATFVALSKNETKEERLHGKDWYNKDSPIEDQGKHASCWSTSGSENISEARHIHSVDIEYTPYSGAYLMDFCDPIKASNSHINSNGKHYCYGYSIFKGLQYAMRHGMPTHWNSIGCGSKHLPDRKLGQVRLRHVLNDVKIFSDVNKALDYLRIQPILGSMTIFNPEFKRIKGGIYRGPTTEKSVFSSWHTVSIRSITIEDGETIATVKNSHGLGSGCYGYIRVSMDVILLELNTKGKPSFPSPGRLFRFFTFGEVRTDFEKEVVEWYVDGEKKDDQVTSSEYTTFLILEGVFNNTCGSVFEDENGENEVVGSPTDRAILKWAIQLQSKMNYRFSKFGSSIIKGSPLNSKPKCLGIVVNNQKKGEKSVRNHWKGSAAFILDKCTKYDSNGEYLEMSETKKTQLKDAINDMTARKLLCIAIAFKELRREDIQRQKKQREQWVLSCEDLVLLAIFGIKNPCLKYDDEKQASLDFEDEDEDVDEQDASKAYLADLADMDDSTICPSISEGLKNFPVWTIGAVDNSERKLNYDQVFVRDFVPNALAFLLNKEPEIVRNFILKTLRRQWEKKTDRFQHGEGVMPYSFKVFHEPVRNLETLIADFGETAIGRVAPVDSGFWWITLLRAAECQKSIRLILSMCLSEGFDIFPILLCADGSCLIDRRMGVYSYPIEIQALFFLALRCAALLLKQDGEGTEMVEQIVKKLHALSYHMRSCFWLDLKQLNEIYLYKTEEYSPSAVNKFNAIPEWIFNYKSPHGGLFIGNVSPTRIDFSWFALGNCIAMLSSLATPEQSSAIIDLIEARCEELVGEIPLKVSYPTIESDEWRIVTGCDPKNTRWSYPSGGSWRARRAIEVAEARLHKDRWPEYYVGKLGRYKQARKCQTWSIAGYLVPKMILDDGIIDTQFLGQCSGQAAGYVEEEILVAHGNGGFSICATSGKVDAMFEV